jgi:hypothetical protein
MKYIKLKLNIFFEYHNYAQPTFIIYFNSMLLIIKFKYFKGCNILIVEMYD